jgi:hypothetical protein
LLETIQIHVRPDRASFGCLYQRLYHTGSHNQVRVQTRVPSGFSSTAFFVDRMLGESSSSQVAKSTMNPIAIQQIRAQRRQSKMMVIKFPSSLMPLSYDSLPTNFVTLAAVR